jgi:amino-acid N-acetyltransferase
MASKPAQTITTPDRRCVALRRAGDADHEAVEALLRDSELPTVGVAEWLDHFWVAEHENRIVGVAGMERYQKGGLLRSVAVADGWRSSGIGRTLVDKVLEEGRAAGVREVYLLTTTAEHYFPRLGFACVSRDAVPAAVQASAEFTGACPASAVVMRKIVAN